MRMRHATYAAFLLTGSLFPALATTSLVAGSQPVALPADDECLLKECALNALQRRASELRNGAKAPEAPAAAGDPMSDAGTDSEDNENVDAESETTTEKVDTDSETTTEKVDTDSETTTEKVDTDSETTTEKVDTDSETTTEKVDTESETTTEKVDTDSETTTENVDTDTSETTDISTTPTTTTVEVVCADAYAQCGGADWKGPSCCKGNRICHETNEYYASCMSPKEVIAANTTTTTTTTTNADPEHCQLEYQQCGGMTNRGTPFVGKSCCQGGYICAEVSENYKQCTPTKKGGPHFVYKPSEKLQEASKAPLYTFYVYRAESDDNDYVTNVNVANLPGVIWYLHNEVVWKTPRKFNITRIYRHKIMTRGTQPLLDLGMHFGVRFAYDSAQCTGPWNCDLNFEKYGYFVGCNNLGEFPFPTYKIYYEDAKWYTLPGPCSSNTYLEKDASCIDDQPGGMCEGIPTGQGNCTYSISAAGDLSLNDIEGISDYAAFVKAGNEEFNKTADKGVGMTFWDGLNDTDANAERVAHVAKLFKEKYPSMPSHSEMLSPPCDFKFEEFYTGTTTATTTLSTTTTTTTKLVRNCEDAKPGTSCYSAVKWAMRDGIHVHPNWYPGLSATSSFSDFQAQVHRASPQVCGPPCAAFTTTAPAQPAPITAVTPAPAMPAPASPTTASIPGCRDATPGESCYSAVKWAMLHGIVEHPRWYPGLTKRSTFREFQAQVHKATPKKCPPPCAD